MTHKHTQGNWEISKHGNNDSFGVYAEGQSHDIAIVKGGNEEGGKVEANAKLIAAAPRMLQTLEQFIHAVEHEGAVNGRIVDAVIIAKDVIRRATA